MSIVGLALAAGASTRMKSARSKLLFKLMGESVVSRAHALMSAISAETPIFVLGHQRDEIRAQLQSETLEFRDCLQEEPKGTADAVLKALPTLDSYKAEETHVFIMPGDAVLFAPQSLKDFCQSHIEKKAQLSFITCLLDEPGAYGRVCRDSQSRVSKIVEFKNANDQERQIKEINSGVYLVRLDLLKSALEEIKPNELTHEFYFTDIVEIIYKKSGLVQSFIMNDPTECLGVNTQADLALARRVLRHRINHDWMLKGVEMDDPESIWIDSSVSLSPDVSLGRNVELRGRSQLQGPCRIESFSVLEDAVVGANSKVGPFARLRPGTKLDESVKIGNFVETKNSHFMKASKANHLSYVGDSEVGEKSNIGAGTITCNYDGFSKHKTQLGKNVFIGSNSSLVAPVQVDDGAMVGAGSVITQSVSKDSIAVARGDQREVTGAAKRFRDKRNLKG